MDLIASLGLGDFETAEQLLKQNAALSEPSGGALHLMAKRNEVEAVKWLLAHGANPNGMWPHWDAEVTPLHLAAREGHADVVRVLLAAGADPSIRDSKHDSDSMGWASYFEKPEIVELLRAHGHPS
jgi:ankyrin repeat protein